MATRKKFGGFTEQQQEAVARKMGFSGPMNKFNEFLSSSPENAARFSRMTKTAVDLVSGEPANMAAGGTVRRRKPPVAPKPAPPTQAQIITNRAIANPISVITPARTQRQRPGTVRSGEIVPRHSGQAGEATTARGDVVDRTAVANVSNQPPTATVRTDIAAGDVNRVTQGLVGAQGTVGRNSRAIAATARPSVNATVQGQLDRLMDDFKGGQTPAWAAGAMRMANTAMAQRGLGASSMAAGATTQAAMESAIGIALADAQTYSQFEMKNLDNRQQAALQNAQSFLTMDLANLDNRQQATIFKTQARVQALFNDQAAENASRQFNASSKNQSNQFFASLKTQVSQFNATQRNATSMFNTEQINAVRMFNSQVKNQRDEFNATNRLIIDQANARWRQTVSTNNNVQQNENNRLNAQLATGMTESAYNNLWQRERDIMSYVFTASENASERANQLIMQRMTGDAYKDAAGEQRNAELWRVAGSFAGSLFDSWLG